MKKANAKNITQAHFNRCNIKAVAKHTKKNCNKKMKQVR